MKVVILAGGRGTRMGGDTDVIPKPMLTVGGIPMIHHIMRYFLKYHYSDFIILGGYKIQVIADYFQDQQQEFSDVAILDTGEDTPTGQRLLEAEPLIKEDDFFLTYGDGIGNIILPYIPKEGYVGTVTAVHPPGRFGTLTLENVGERILRFDEKQRLENVWINGGFMHFKPSVFNYIEKDEMMEFDVLPRLAEDRVLRAYRHHGWWACMDTPRDREYLEQIWKLKRCYWR